MFEVLLFVLSLIALWFGAGLAVSAIVKVSHHLRASSFVVSFFVLGLFTSSTEIMVGINSVIEKTPEIYVGNLIGGSVVIFLLIMPLLALFGNGAILNHTFKLKNLILAVYVVVFPALLTFDNVFDVMDALISIMVYSYFLIKLEKANGVIDRVIRVNLFHKTLFYSFFKIAIALIIVFFSSRMLVEQTPRLGELFGISPFLVSMLLISLGTNIPELSIAVRTLFSNKKDIAFGNYVGSATLNTLEMAVLTLWNGKAVPAEGSNFSIVAFVLGLILFVLFVKSKNEISRKEGLLLLGFYILFVCFELFTGPGWYLT